MLCYHAAGGNLALCCSMLGLLKRMLILTGSVPDKGVCMRRAKAAEPGGCRGQEEQAELRRGLSLRLRCLLCRLRHRSAQSCAGVPPSGSWQPTQASRLSGHPRRRGHPVFNIHAVQRICCNLCKKATSRAGSICEGVTQGLCHSLLVDPQMRKLYRYLYRTSYMGVCFQPEDMYLCR